MLNITVNACKRVEALLKKMGKGASGALRLRGIACGCTGTVPVFAFAREPQGGETVIESCGIRFFVDAGTKEALEGATLDYEGGFFGRGFTIENRSKQVQCTCGRSFSFEE